MIKYWVGKHIEELRIAKGYSQESFAVRCHMNIHFIADVEAGKRDISLESLYKMSEALGVTVSELCDYERPIHNTMLLMIEGKAFLMESDRELSDEQKEDIEVIFKLAYDDDEPSLDYELQEAGIEGIYDADSYDIAKALQRTIKSELGIGFTFKKIDEEALIIE